MSIESTHTDVAVIGAGAAGLVAAFFAARGGRKVVLLERTADGGRKILISGGGRCNILPSVVQPERYVTDSSPNTLKKILLSWPLSEQRVFFEEILGQPLVREEETGKLFPASNRARDVRDGLLHQVRAAGARVWTGATVHDVHAPSGEHGPWRIEIEGAPTLCANAVVIATGGLSVPTTGSDGTGLRIAERLGHTMHPTYPALTPLLASPPVHAHLAGVSLNVKIRNRQARYEASGGFLFTHRGYSGPVVLDVSHFAVRSAESDPTILTVQWTAKDEAAWNDVFRGGKGPIGKALAGHLPDRLARQWLMEADVDAATPLSQLTKEARTRVMGLLTEYPLPWTGDEGYKKAEVTGGGVCLSEVDPRTLESRHRPRLYFCGEVLDAFGPIGGHNFLWAWATGRAAGSATTI